MGLKVAVDGSGLDRPLAGIGRYTAQILAAMRVERPQHRLTVVEAARGLPLVARHLDFPARVRRTRPSLYWSPAGLLPLGRLGLPTAITVHDLAIYRNPDWFPGGQWLSTRVVVPRSLRQASAVIAVSASTARDLDELFGVGSDRVSVIHHGVGREFSPRPAADARRRLGLPDRFILFVGTIEPRKNLESLLQAWALLPGRPPLVIAGGWGWRYEAVQARLERLGDGVRLLGPVAPADLPDLYSAATCLAHPAWYEGFGLTPLEAMACGTPVVCSDRSSLPEVIGDAGVMVDPGDVQGLAAALERVCGDPDLHLDLRRRGLLRAAEFSWARSAARTWGVLEGLAGAGSG